MFDTGWFLSNVRSHKQRVNKKQKLFKREKTFKSTVLSIV